MVSNTEAFKSIWSDPRGTISRLAQSPDQSFLLKLILIEGALGMAFNTKGGGIGMWLLGLVVLGPLSAAFFYFLNAFLLSKIAPMFKGASDQGRIKVALAWGALPSTVVTALFGLLGLAYTAAVGGTDTSPGVGVLILLVLNIVAFLWTFTIGLRSLSEGLTIPIVPTILVMIIVGIIDVVCGFVWGMVMAVFYGVSGAPLPPQ